MRKSTKHSHLSQIVMLLLRVPYGLLGIPARSNACAVRVDDECAVPREGFDRDVVGSNQRDAHLELVAKGLGAPGGQLLIETGTRYLIHRFICAQNPRQQSCRQSECHQ
jgi:hypothetical protein